MKFRLKSQTNTLHSDAVGILLGSWEESSIGLLSPLSVGGGGGMKLRPSICIALDNKVPSHPSALKQDAIAVSLSLVQRESSFGSQCSVVF